MWLSDRTLDHLRGVADAPDTGGTRYRIVAPLGRGGMGTVYHAEDTVLRRGVALKVLRLPELHDLAAHRMMAEARILARLEHPGIVPVHDAGTLPDGRVYYAMKLVRGQSLDRIPLTSMPLAARLRIFRRICEPLAFAHAHGIVHRDLKPANIMVGEWGAVFVMDWGVARDPNRRQEANGPAGGEPLPPGAPAATMHGTRLGTPGWMAPEQERGDTAAVDARADVFGLGALLRFLLGPPAGRRDVPRPLRAIVHRATAAEPERRYADAGALADDIDRFLAGEPVLAHAERPLERIARFHRRYRVPILLIATYLLMRVLLIAFRRAGG